MKTRFAPSPTGLIHLGNARTALFSALYAASRGGDFLLRIEDTDEERSTDEYSQALCHDLKWLGLHWQEGFEIGGEHRPYRQSERFDIYEHYYNRLLELERAYPCFCSEDDLALERKVQKASGQAPRYSGKCKRLSVAERQAKIDAGIKPTLRFAVADDEVVRFKDLAKGEQHFKGGDIGDFIIRRANGTASFMFCNAIDDSLMGVTHIMRGEDHLTNTPRQLMILSVLELRKPQYVHMALINGTDGSPLSKRNGSRNIQDFRHEGFLPLALLNYMARLGHYYESNDLMTWSALAKHFSTERLGSSAARFDHDQLMFWQRTAVHSLNDLEFEAWISKALQKVPAEQKALFIATIRDNVVFPAEAEQYAQIFFEESLRVEDHIEILVKAGRAFFEAGIAALNQYGSNFEAISDHLNQTLAVKGKSLFQPLRVALTAELHGPKLGGVIQLLGREKIHARFKHALHLIEK